MSVGREFGGYWSWYSVAVGLERMDPEYDQEEHTFRAKIGSALSLRYTLQPARLYTVETALALDKFFPTEINRTIAIPESDAPSSAEEYYT